MIKLSMEWLHLPSLLEEVNDLNMGPQLFCVNDDRAAPQLGQMKTELVALATFFEVVELLLIINL